MYHVTATNRGPCAAFSSARGVEDDLYDGLGEELAGWWATEFPEDIVFFTKED